MIDSFSTVCHDGDRVVVLLTFLLAAMMAIVWYFINFSIGCHDGDRVENLSTFLLPAMMAIVW